MNFREIYEGWKNDATAPEKLEQSIRELASYRMGICRACPNNSKVAPKSEQPLLSRIRADEHCIVCACPLAKKTKSPKSECPLSPPKWEKVIEESESSPKLGEFIDKITT